METNKKTSKPSITKRNTRKTEQDQAIHIIDVDAELALALSTSNAEASGLSGLSFETNTLSQEDFEHQQHLLHQEESDAEYARQLAAEFETHQHSHHTLGAGSDVTYDGENIDAVLEEIARIEAQEQLKATGHAYNAKTNINRVLADEDEEEAHIREKVKRQNELNEWRAERERQDAEFAATETIDRAHELSKKYADSDTKAKADVYAEAEVEAEAEPIYLTKEDLRRARLAFFTAANANANAKASAKASANY